eukprot:GFKZ01015773.1.p1 GENE.GFKZ01015773.1~~GFKZ01015773.1.p1  ORF type:complete len:936 (+),score=168.04 GFKZ01015773.1:1761-4568(+)
MSRHFPTPDQPQPPPSPSTGAVLIEIPANEFSNLSNTTPSSTPPPRLTARAPKTPTDWQTKHYHAEAARKASLESMRHRCKDHIDHVANVVKFVKESRRQSSRTRHEQLSSMQRHAAERRRRLLTKRADDMAEARARRARVLRERSEERKRADAQSASAAREEAAERRGRLLSERSVRASRFSPTRGMSLSPVRSFSPSRMESAMSSSPSRMSDSTIEDGDAMCRSPASPSQSPMEVDQFSIGPTRRHFDVLIEKEERGQRSLTRDELRAARKIVGYYFLAKARREMTEAGVLGPQLKNYTFEDITTCMETEKAQEATEYVFRALGMRKASKRVTKSATSRQRAERRVLLSCLLIALHPKAVMEEKTRTGDSEGPMSIDSMALYCARRMILCLQAGSLGAIASAWLNWRRAFLEWKENDAENLLKAMIEDAVATEALRGAIDRAFSEAENIEEVKSSLGGGSTLADMRRQEHAVWQEQLQLKQEKIREAVARLSGAAGERRLDSALVASRHVQDEHLVHEIMIDLPRLLERVQSSSAVPGNVWSKLRNELSMSPPIRDELAARLADLSRMLNAMIPGCFSLVGNESEVELNVDFAVGLVSRAVEGLQRCQAEAYDGALQEWYEGAMRRLQSGEDFVKHVVEVLEEVTEFVRIVRVDVLTHRIRHSAPIVQQFGAAWERSHFQGHVVSGRFMASLPRTKQVMVDVLRRLGENGGQLREEGAKGGRILRTLMTHFVVHMIMRGSAWREEEMPEVMHLDVERIWKMQNEGQKCVLTASLGIIGGQFLQSKGMLGSNGQDISVLGELLGRGDVGLREIQEGFIEWVRGNIGKASNDETDSLSSSDRELLCGMVERTAKAGDAMYALMQQRLGKAVLGRCLKERRETGASSGEPEEDAGAGMGIGGMGELMQGLSRSVEGLVGHMVEVHGSSLTTLLKAL